MIYTIALKKRTDSEWIRTGLIFDNSKDAEEWISVEKGELIKHGLEASIQIDNSPFVE